MKRSFEESSLLLYLISSYSSLAGSGHKGENGRKITIKRSPQRTTPYKKYFAPVFGIGLSRAVAAVKKFQGEFDRKLNPKGRSHPRLRGCLYFLSNSPAGGLGEFDRRGTTKYLSKSKTQSSDITLLKPPPPRLSNSPLKTACEIFA